MVTKQSYKKGWKGAKSPLAPGLTVVYKMVSLGDNQAHFSVTGSVAKFAMGLFSFQVQKYSQNLEHILP